MVSVGRAVRDRTGEMVVTAGPQPADHTTIVSIVLWRVWTSMLTAKLLNTRIQSMYCIFGLLYVGVYATQRTEEGRH